MYHYSSPSSLLLLLQFWKSCQYSQIDSYTFILVVLYIFLYLPESGDLLPYSAPERTAASHLSLRFFFWLLVFLLLLFYLSVAIGLLYNSSEV